MFRGWVLVKKGRMFIEIAVIELVDDFVHLFFENFEVYTHSQFVQLRGPDGDLHLPVVAVRLFTVTWIFTQMMGTGEMGFDEDIKHGWFLRGYFF